MDIESQPPDWVRAVLPMAVLSIVCEEETYGYAIAHRLQSAGLGAIKGGTLYPVLNRLEAADLLTSSWREGVGGPGRKFFTATAAGRAHIDERATAWRTFSQQVDDLLPHPRSTP